ncbi:MAG: DUF5723 family protein [Bacteroidales bacterium]|nr:DUF5723 family protein [Bacteroidales bacterium]
MKQTLRITKCALIVSILMLIFAPGVKAQNFSQYFGDNYAGISGVYNNPASIANSRYVVDITLVGMSSSFNQNYFGAQRKFMFNQLNFNGRKRDAWRSLWHESPWLLPVDNGADQKYLIRPEESDKSYSAVLQSEIQIFNFMIACGPKFSFGITERVRTIANFDNASWGMMESMFYQGPQSDLGRIENGEFRFAAATWNEIGISLASQIWDGGKHYIKFGASFKIWQGLSSGYLVSDNLNYQYDNDGNVTIDGNFMWGVSADVNDEMQAIKENQANGLYSDAGENNTRWSEKTLDYMNAATNKFFTQPFESKYWKNLGFGLDVGLVYEWRPDFDDYLYDMDGKTGLVRKDKNKYRMKISVAVVDINLNGGIKFTRDSNLAYNMATSNNGLFSTSLFNNVLTGTEEMNAVAENTFGNEANSTLNATGNDTIYAMKLSPTATLSIDFYLGANFYVNLGAYVPFSTFTGHKVTEFENSSYNVVNLHSNASFNLTPRYERKWFGFAIPVTYQLTNKAQVDVGLGLRLGPVWIGSNTIITNCFTKYWEGIDISAAVKIPIMYRAPKDKDNDGVSDRRDECPYQQGTWETRGCPDTDGDGIVDSEDECPCEAGLVEFNGCPDRDGDGIIDKLDECPDVAGLAKFNGCPDTDGDGIPDHLDLCPEEAGLEKFKGCPESYFIMDRDGDGIPDDIDECPDLPGTIEFNGCPEGALKYEMLDGVHFDTNKATLKDEAKKFLDEYVIALSKNNKPRNIYIIGHADATGNDKINDPLSLQRAKSVKNYLVEKGVNDRVISLDYEGSRKPVAPNNTKDGRAKNRRVEIEISFIDKQ